MMRKQKLTIEDLAIAVNRIPLSAQYVYKASDTLDANFMAEQVKITSGDPLKQTYAGFVVDLTRWIDGHEKH